MISRFIVIVLLGGALADSVPEFKASLSFNAMRDFALDVLQPVTSIFLVDLKVPITLDVRKKLSLLGEYELTAKNVVIKKVDLDWQASQFRPFDESDINRVYLDLERLNLVMVADMCLKKVNASNVMFNTSTTVLIQNLTQTLILRFDENTKEDSWGFTPVIENAVTNIDGVKLHFAEPQPWSEKVVNSALSMALSLVPKMAHSLIMDTISPKLIAASSASQMTFNMPLKTLDQYQISMHTTSAPVIVKGSKDNFFNVHLDMGMKNLNTSQECPLFNEGNLPDRVYQTKRDIEIVVGDNLINQLLWFAIDSNLLNLTISQKQLEKMKSLPLEMTTTGFRLFAPQFAFKYGDFKGIYLQVTTAKKDPAIYIRSGRLVANLAVNLNFIVDLDSSQYPQDNVNDCKNCVSANVAETVLSITAAAYDLNTTHIGANVMEVRIDQMSYVSGEITNMPYAVIVDTFNYLLNALIPSVSVQLSEGIKNPVVGLFQVKELDLVMSDSSVLVALEFEQN